MNSLDKFSKIGYILSSRVFVTGLNFLSLIVFARLLMPEDYGIFGLSISIVGVYRLVINFYTEFIIHDQDLLPKELSTFFWVNIIISLFLLTVTFCIQEQLSSIGGMPELGKSCLVLALLISLESIGIQSRIIMAKTLNFKVYSAIESISVALSFLVSYIIILKGFSYWGLIFKFSLDILIANCIFIFWSKWIPKFDFNLSLLSRGLHFSMPLAANSIVMSFSLFAQNFVINRFLGKASLGIFNQANKIYTISLQSVVYPIGRFAFPYLSEKRENKETYKREYLYLCKTMSIIALPLAFFIITFPRETVLLILGENWLEVVPVLKAFSIVLLANCFLHTHRWLFLSLGNTSRMFFMALIKIFLYLALIIATVNKGLIAVAYALSFAEFILLVPFILVAKKGTDISLVEIGRSQLVGFLSAFASLILPLLLWLLLSQKSMTIFVSTIMPFYLICYLLALKYFRVFEFLKGKRAQN